MNVIIHRHSNGFTVVELAMIILVIGILVTVGTFGFGTWQRSIAGNTVKSDLTNVATAMENVKNFNNGYPTSLPTTFRPSDNVVISLTVTSAGTFCINGYHLKQPSVRMSISSTEKNKVKDSLCSGAVTGSPLPSGATIPSP